MAYLTHPTRFFASLSRTTMGEDHLIPPAVANLRSYTRSSSQRSNRSVTFSIQDEEIDQNNDNAVADTETEDEPDDPVERNGERRKKYRRSLRFEDSLDDRPDEDDACMGNPEKVNADLETQAKEDPNEGEPPLPSSQQSKWQQFLEWKYIRWIYANHSWHHFRPVIRASLAAWLGLLLFLIQPVLVLMGQAAFYILVCAFLASPRDAIRELSSCAINLLKQTIQYRI